ncbi:MAG: ASCH domain-containing protein [Thermoprotei archaeon]|nr:MAG: ASCH domain-containing protein [Thermoprotei archaeon]RLE99480.1 MAG: ASCH domain-containing protein [Thermoprotei archaeon]
MDGSAATTKAAVLRLKKKYLDLVAEGVKCTTIRRGKRRIESARLKIVGGKDVVIEARVRSIRYKRVRELSLDDALRDGFLDLEELIEELKEIYPSLKSDEWVTIVEFEVVGRPSCSGVEISYEGLSSRDIALLALKYDLVRGRGAEVLKLVVKEGSIWRATVATGRVFNRFFIRKIVLDALEKLKEHNLI